MATSGPDTLTGTNKADTIGGGAGDDVIFGFNAQKTGAKVGRIETELVVSGIDGAVFAGFAPGRPNKLLVVQKDTGIIWSVNPDTGRKSKFLNIPDAELGSAREEGLLGLAFHPDHAQNGRFFVHLVNADGDIEVREYVRSDSTPNRAVAEPVQTVITIPHPTFSNHNGGALAFSPRDGYLYVALGDGGGGNDPDGNGQDRETLLGSVLRLDVDGDDFAGDESRNYAVPTDNPFVGTAGADEIWAYGLRNPWRISFDTDGGLYIADVGQNAREELNYQPADSDGGENYGWSQVEGTLGTPPAGSTPPIFEYGHDVGRSITGGHVFGANGSLKGSYVFADFITGEVWSLDVQNGVAANVANRTDQITGEGAPLQLISSFGIDADGGIYTVSLAGDIHRLNPAAFAGDLGDTLRGGAGNDKLYGGPGDDLLYGNRDADMLRGGFGNDRLHGGQGRDTLHGDAGDDVLFGGIGADTLSGGSGLDRMRGGAGNDTFVFKPGDDIGRLGDFQDGRDLIEIIRGADSFEDLTISRSGKNVRVEFSDVTIVVEDHKVSDLTASDFIF